MFDHHVVRLLMQRHWFDSQSTIDSLAHYATLWEYSKRTTSIWQRSIPGHRWNAYGNTTSLLNSRAIKRTRMSARRSKSWKSIHSSREYWVAIPHRSRRLLCNRWSCYDGACKADLCTFPCRVVRDPGRTYVYVASLNADVYAIGNWHRGHVWMNRFSYDVPLSSECLIRIGFSCTLVFSLKLCLPRIRIWALSNGRTGKASTACEETSMNSEQIQ